MKLKNEKPKIEFVKDALLINQQILAFSDLHIGYEDVLAGRGIFPRHQIKDIIGKLNGIFFDLNMRGIKLEKIIICGDLKHEFGEISNVEWRETIKILDFLVKQCKEVILIKGNHDTFLEPIAKKRGILLKTHYNISGVCFLHGDRLHGACLDGCKIVVFGHLHPSITISDEYKKEKYKCFLKGSWKRKIVYILPSFSEVSLGYDLFNDNRKISSLIVDDKKLRNFEIIIYNNQDKKEYSFGKLSKFRKNNF